MPCKFEETLSRCIDNDLDAREAAEFRVHLSHCPSCKVLLHEIRESEKAFREVINSSLPTSSLAEKVVFTIQKETPVYPSQKSKSTSNKPIWGWAIAYIAVLGLAFFLFQPISSHLPNESTPSIDPRVKETFWVAPLGNSAWAGNRKLVVGEFISLESSVLREFRGLLALCSDQEGKNKITWDGNGIFSASNNTIKWDSGNGEFNFTLDSPVVLQIRSVVLTIYGTKIRISGKAGLSVRINLLEGKAIFVSPETKGKFVLAPENIGGVHPVVGINSPILIKNGKIEYLAAAHSSPSDLLRPSQAKTALPPFLGTPANKNSFHAGWIFENPQTDAPSLRKN